MLYIQCPFGEKQFILCSISLVYTTLHGHTDLCLIWLYQLPLIALHSAALSMSCLHQINKQTKNYSEENELWFPACRMPYSIMK